MSDVKPKWAYEPRWYPCKVVEWIDGDTAVVDIDRGHGQWSLGEKVRLRRSDAAESSSTDPKLKQMADLAHHWVNYLVPGGTFNRLVTYYTPKSAVEEREKFGRIQADFAIGTAMSLTTVLFQKRLTVPYGGENKAKVQEKHLENWEYHDLNGSFSVLT